MAFGARIKELRMKKKGVSLQEMADAMDISKAHLWDLESGRSLNPSMDLLKKLSTYLGESISSLVGEEPDANAGGKAKTMFRQLNELKDDDLKLIDGLLQQLHKRKIDGAKD